MESILITPKNRSDLKFIYELLNKLKLSPKVLSENDKEDLGLSLLMKEVDRTKKVSRDTVMKKLKK